MSAVSKRIGAPAQVITANRLRDGIVIYLRAHGDHFHWSENIRDASVFEAGDVNAVLARASVDVRENRIVDPYAIGVGADHTPLTQREAVRAGGPTIPYGA
ncbi:MAG: DUF2849 domain-containing protein [Alphaproteobacteria bacterium]